MSRRGQARFQALAGQQGLATLEAVITLPILFLLILAGFLCGYYLYIKVLLTWHVHDLSEREAASTPIISLASAGLELIESEPPAGLSRERFEGYVVPVPVGEYGFVVATACYRMPFRWPRISFGKSGTGTEPPAPAGLLARLQQLIDAVKRYLDEGEEILEGAEDVVNDLDMARQIASQLAQGQRGRKQAARLIGSWAVDAGMREFVCGTDGSWVVSARAVVWIEQTQELR